MCRPATITAILLTIALAFNSGCDTLNVNNAPWDPQPYISSFILEAPNGWAAGETAMFTIDWESGTSPFTFYIYSGTSGSPFTEIIWGHSPLIWDFTLEEGDWFSYTVTISDSNMQTDTYTGTYGPVGPPITEPMVITNVSVIENVLTVTMADAEGDDITVSVTDITGLMVDSNTKIISGGNGDAVFTWHPVDVFAGGYGTTTISAWDEAHADNPATESADIAIGFPVIMPDEGELWAIPLATSCMVGDTVSVLVVSGPFPGSAAFNYLNGVAVTVTDGGDYVAGTFNVGSIGGEVKTVDGIWAWMDPAPWTFFVPEDFMMDAVDVAADPSLDFMAFNITPLGAGEVTTGGDLFNFGMDFDEPGVYTLGFLEFQDVRRTYYSDNAAVEHNWTNLSNECLFETTITVN